MLFAKDLQILRQTKVKNQNIQLKNMFTLVSWFILYLSFVAMAIFHVPENILFLNSFNQYFIRFG